MKTVGEILKSKRKEQKKNWPQISRETKLSPRILKALEENDFDSLPPVTFIKGFIKIYAQNLGLETAKILAVFRRDWQEKENKKIILSEVDNPLNKKGLNWTPKTTFILLISFLITLTLSYLVFQLNSFFQPPKLVISSPLVNQKITGQTVKVIGQTDKDASVYVNNQLIETDKGKFSYQLRLFSGETTVEVKAVDRRGKQTLISRKLIIDKNP